MRQHYLKEGKHFKIVKRRLYLTQEAVQLLTSKRGLPLPVPEQIAAQRQDAARPRQLLLIAPFEGEMVVWNVCYNKQIILVIYPQENADNPQFIGRMRVRTNENFRVRMKVRARALDEGWFEHVGNLPRWRGKY